MQSAHTTPLAEGLSPSQQVALLNLLGDEDPTIYQTVREKILSCGPPAAEWLRPHTTSNDPALRRHAQEIVLHFDRQAADDQFLAFCLRHGEEFNLEQGAWLLAQTRYPSINLEAYQALLDGYASELRVRLDLVAEPQPILRTVNHYLFDELGLHLMLARRIAPRAERLLIVGRRVRSLYPAQNAERVKARISDAFLEALVRQVSSGFGGKVAIAPRLFLRELIDVMDRVDLHADYDPLTHYELELTESKLNDEELAARRGPAKRLE